VAPQADNSPSEGVGIGPTNQKKRGRKMIKAGSKFSAVCIIEEGKYFSAQVEASGTILQKIKRTDFIIQLAQVTAENNNVPMEQVKIRKLKFF
jgi:hypothetical protein